MPWTHPHSNKTPQNSSRWQKNMPGDVSPMIVTFIRAPRELKKYVDKEDYINTAARNNKASTCRATTWTKETNAGTTPTVTDGRVGWSSSFVSRYHRSNIGMYRQSTYGPDRPIFPKGVPFVFRHFWELIRETKCSRIARLRGIQNRCLKDSHE